MRFMTSSGSELRIPENDDQQDGFVVEDARASMKATVRLAKPSIGEGDNYTWMQVPIFNSVFILRLLTRNHRERQHAACD